MPLSSNWSPFIYHVKHVTGYTGYASVSTRVSLACVFSSVKIEFKFLVKKRIETLRDRERNPVAIQP